MNPDYITEAMRAKASLEWFACDEDGAVAWFESCGYAPIPESVCISERDRREAIELVKQLETCSLSIRYPNYFTKEELSRSGDLHEIFVVFSCRGVYAYEVPDADKQSAPYERMTAPVTPIRLDQLPTELRHIITRTKLPCRFSECQQIPLDIAHRAEPFVGSQTPLSGGRVANLKRPTRLSYEESCQLLLRVGFLNGIDFGDYSGQLLPTLPDHRPQSDDDLPFGVRFFRTWVGNGKPFGLQTLDPDCEESAEEHHLENLTLRRTYFGRSEISRISFQNTDLSESTLCWNDFIEVDFTDAELSDSDLRASLFTRTIFAGTNLRNTDLRRSTFEECSFAGADLSGAKLTSEQGERIRLSEQQKQAIDWQKSAGEEPPGG